MSLFDIDLKTCFRIGWLDECAIGEEGRVTWDLKAADEEKIEGATGATNAGTDAIAGSDGMAGMAT